MTGHTRLYRRGSTYYHRAAVPKDIQDTYGKREETFSLKTKDKAEALLLVRVEAVRVDRLFAKHRRDQSRVTLNTPNPAERGIQKELKLRTRRFIIKCHHNFVST